MSVEMVPGESVYRATTGIVAILDALGSRQMNIGDVQKFILTRDSLMSAMPQVPVGYSVGDMSSGRNVIVDSTIMLQQFTFGDTLVFAWRCPLESLWWPLTYVGFWLRRFFVDALEQGLLFRGALSHGSFYADAKTNTIMGPAVARAASWYEAANFAGVLVPPSTGMEILKTAVHVNENPEHKFKQIYLEHQCVLKTGREKLWTLNWPLEFLHRFPNHFREDFKYHVYSVQKLLTLLDSGNAPTGDAELKHRNTVDFFRDCEEDALRRNIKYIPAAEALRHGAKATEDHTLIFP